MDSSSRRQSLPDSDRLSLLAAIILLAYVLARFVDLPSQSMILEGLGLYIEIRINFQSVVGIIVAGLTASGTEWLLRDHPALGKSRTIQHWLLPALTAWAIQLPLSQIPLGAWWWAGFILGGLLLILVLIAEYITVDLDDIRQPLASAGLTAVSFTLFLVLAAALHFAEQRLLFLLPVIGLASGLISLRILHLRTHGRWAFTESLVILLVSVQVAAALHYWPISPVAFGLVLLGPAYALTNLFGNLAEGEPTRQAVVEPVLVMGFLLGAAYFMR